MTSETSTEKVLSSLIQQASLASGGPNKELALVQTAVEIATLRRLLDEEREWGKRLFVALDDGAVDIDALLDEWLEAHGG
jgi:hypothetical protein